MTAAAFLAPLQARHVMRRHEDDRPDEGGWILDAPLVYRSAVAERTITVPAGFGTDFASVPRLPFVFVIFGDTAHEPATVHDYLYRSQIMSRALADRVFAEALAVIGAAWWRRALMYLGARVGGWRAWREYAAAAL